MQTKQNSKSHWNQVYRTKKVEQLGWYELSPQPSLDLIRQHLPDRGSRILHVGAGATTLVDELLELGFRHQIVNDISVEALDKLKHRLGALAKEVTWVEDDITNPRMLPALPAVDLWHDRAVLHFFTEADAQASYFSLLHQLVKPGGFVILATFHLSGASMCSGLPVHRYDASMLKTKLGGDFDLAQTFQYTYTMPSGDVREYVYAVFRHK